MTPSQAARELESNHAYLLKQARRLARGDRDLAEDFVQDAKIRVLGEIESFEGGCALRVWATRAIGWIAYDFWHKGKTMRWNSDISLEALELDSADRKMDPCEIVSLSAAQDEIVRAIKGLMSVRHDPVCGALILRVKGKTYDEIAQIQGVPMGTVKSRIVRARAALMEGLG